MFFNKKKKEDYDLDMDNIPAHIALLWMVMDDGQRKERCLELMDIMKERKLSVLWL